MPRPVRLHLNDTVYYLTLEGPQNEPIFRDQADYNKYLDILNKCKSEFHFKLYSYALLPDHLYLLVEADPHYSVSKIMQRVTPLYTKYYNARYDRKGPLFQKRFRSVIVEKELYLPRMTRFMHWMPVHRNFAPDFQSPVSSSYAAYTGNASPISLDEEIREVKEILAMDGAVQNAYENYLKLADTKELEHLDIRLSKGVILGSEQFTTDVRKKMQNQAEKETMSNIQVAVPQIPMLASKRTLVLSSFLVAAVALSVFSVSLNLSIANFRPMPGSLAPAGAQTSSSVEVSPAPILNNTIWEIDMVSVSPDGTETPIRDKIKFHGSSFESHFFAGQGFRSSNYSVTVQKNGVITWETIQKNEKGETVSWRGDWRNNKMAGVLSYQPDGNQTKDFSFFSQSLGARNA